MPALPSVTDHLARVLRLGAPLPARPVRLQPALGCAVAEDVLAPIDLPPFDNAAMDGYAVRAAELAAVSLAVVGDGAAGAGTPPPLPPAAAARVMTGAPIPAGADTVVPVEDTDRGVPAVRITAVVRPGAHIRRAGEDVHRGQRAIRAGEPITAGRLALLAALGIPAVTAHRRPVVAVLATGNELSGAGTPLAPGMIYESNGAMLAALVRTTGGEPRELPVVHDDPALARSVLVEAARGHDLVLTAGGISAGDYEVVRQALGPTGTVAFESVAMSPGRPQGWGTLAGTPLLALPGNPVGAFVSYHLFAAPLIRRLLGWAAPEPPWHPEPIADELTARRGRTRLCLATRTSEGVRPLPGGHFLSTLAGADRLLRVEHDLAAGDLVPVLEL
ncbi:MAG TPA: gephyrin-like molybdotransferase Glp [Mycobacteriales bacterium]|nr:gephyrin-like molybdotransferase Glp [Mycobacteriales bacterium]